MSTRQIIDEDGQTWECRPERPELVPGRDVNLLCTTKDMKTPLRVKVSWQWMKVAEKGLARMIASAAAAAPTPLLAK